MELKDLTGKHLLQGCDLSNQEVKTWGEEFEQCEVIRFMLDDVVYMAIEDPSDGYRSSMRDIVVDQNYPMTNTFAPVHVVGIYVDNSEGGYEQSDILRLVDVETGKTVLEVGTDNSADYYPRFVCNFDPSAMIINQ